MKIKLRLIYALQGQSGSETLASHCDSGVDYITLGFVNMSPQNEPSGYPGTNFGEHCWAGTYNNTSGEPTQLLSNCIDIKGDINYCQQQGVKIILSIGGAHTDGVNDYQVDADKGASFATFLWKAFGPYDPTWGGPRPFDNGTEHAAVDGFDFDIEAAYRKYSVWGASLSISDVSLCD
jgi:chitinase